MSRTTATGQSGYLEQLDELYAEMTPELPGITQPMMLKALQAGARKFCDKTENWQEWLDPHNLIEEEDEYILEWEWCAELRRIL
jgi:hypothetical protein